MNSEDVNLLKHEEATILKSLDHENIITFKHVSSTISLLKATFKIREIGNWIFLGMELMIGGQLSELIRDRKQKE